MKINSIICFRLTFEEIHLKIFGRPEGWFLRVRVSKKTPCWLIPWTVHLLSNRLDSNEKVVLLIAHTYGEMNFWPFIHCFSLALANFQMVQLMHSINLICCLL